MRTLNVPERKRRNACVTKRAQATATSNPIARVLPSTEAPASSGNSSSMVGKSTEKTTTAANSHRWRRADSRMTLNTAMILTRGSDNPGELEDLVGLADEDVHVVDHALCDLAVGLSPQIGADAERQNLFKHRAAEALANLAECEAPQDVVGLL